MRWEWPPIGFIKLNVDGSSFGNPGDASFGGLLRGADGRWTFGFHGSIRVADNLSVVLFSTNEFSCKSYEA